MSTSTCSTELRVLLAISKVIDQALDLESALESILKILSDTMSMRRATVTLYDPQSGRLAISTSYGLSDQEKQRGVYRMDEGITGIVFRTARPYVVPDISLEPLFLDKTGTRRISQERISFVGVPILLHGSPIGVMNVDRVFTGQEQLDADTEFLTVVATLISQFLSLNEKVKNREAALKQENTSLKYQIAKENHGPYIVGKSQSMLEVEQYVAKVAITKATVLLLGESGTGKTLIGRIIHELSDRKTHPFIKVNCAAIPESLFESELFGHERGAFTGSHGERAGWFELADGGTIFLDEIGELPLTLQTKLLRTLQEGTVLRLGGRHEKKVDVRLVAATHRDLEQEAAMGTFRRDLFYRLYVIPIRLPSLRERPADIPLLALHFLSRANQAHQRNVNLTPEALTRLARHAWPGNIRELANVIERLVLLADVPVVAAETVARLLREADGADRPTLPLSMVAPLAEAAGVRGYWRADSHPAQALARHGGNRSRAAQSLGLTLRQFSYRWTKLGLDPS